MGCQNSKGKSIFICSDGQSSPRKISNESRKIVQEMWLDCKPNVKNFGISVFLRMFDDEEIQDLFYDFKDLKDQDELIKSLEELDHVARVMNSFGICIELLGDVNQFTETVQRLGVVHRRIGIKMEHVTVFGKILIENFADIYQSSWTIAHERAWTEFIGLLAGNFEIGLNGENSRK